jgi:hypothetical protein
VTTSDLPDLDALVRVTEAIPDGPPVGTEGRLYRIDLNDPYEPDARFKLAHYGWAKAVEVVGPPRTEEQRADDLIGFMRRFGSRVPGAQQPAKAGHIAAADRLRARLATIPNWSVRWDGLWISHKIADHETRAAGIDPSVLSTWSLGMWALERSDLSPRERLERRRALALRLGLPEDA